MVVFDPTLSNNAQKPAPSAWWLTLVANTNVNMFLLEREVHSKQFCGCERERVRLIKTAPCKYHVAVATCCLRGDVTSDWGETRDSADACRHNLSSISRCHRRRRRWLLKLSTVQGDRPLMRRARAACCRVAEGSAGGVRDGFNT